MNKTEVANLEMDLLLETIFRRYGYDFRSYAQASVARRARTFLAGTGYRHISEMIPRLIHDEAFFGELVQVFSIPVTDMFRDPSVFLSLRQSVIPVLKTYPFVKIWHAGCATGEEVYSLAILLMEEGLYDRATIFATDFNDTTLAMARNGVYPMGRVQDFSRNYQAAGGKDSFSRYYGTSDDAMSITQSLKGNITFANHNLVTDGVFGEMHLILCRNVLIYFDRTLQNRALKVIDDSLTTGGFLCLGDKESLRFTDLADRFAVLDEPGRIYRKLPDLWTRGPA